MRWAGHAAVMEEMKNWNKILVGKLEGTKQLGRTRRRWADNIKFDLRQIMCDDED
jgi:hypothetical protein